MFSNSIYYRRVKAVLLTIACCLRYNISMKIIDGKAVSAEIKKTITKKIQDEYIAKERVVPTLACVLVGEDPASKVYVSNKEKACKACGLGSILKLLPTESTQEQVAKVIKKLNADENVSGILLQLPLPKHLNEKELINLISPVKDVDCLTNLNLGKLFSSSQKISPCTATGIIDLLDYYNIELDGKNAVVIGRSLLVGKSVANLLEQRNATVTLCHSHTRNLSEKTREADILIVAVGKANFVTSDMVKDGAVVIDVGINRLEKGLVGDVDFNNVKEKAEYITPVPGGVGPMTIAELLKNTLILHEEQHASKEKSL